MVTENDWFNTQLLLWIPRRFYSVLRGKNERFAISIRRVREAWKLEIRSAAAAKKTKKKKNLLRRSGLKLTLFALIIAKADAKYRRIKYAAFV